MSRVCVLAELEGTRTNGETDGEFHVDLYTLPDSLVKMLWDFTASKTEL